ncbi:MAG: helix-turn-helix domain-containing protein [Actinomycetota bacterium]
MRRLDDEVRNEAVLKLAGLNSSEIHLYQELLVRHPQALEDLASATDTTKPAAERGLRALESKGLLSRAPGHEERFLPVSPSLALEGLVLRREQELGQVRALAQHLEEEYRSRVSDPGPAQMVEVLDSPDVVGQRALQMLRAAREELLTFDKPPYTTVAEESDPELEAALERGVRVRAIYAQESLMDPPIGLGLRHVRDFQARGEESRVFPELPFKMNITDRTTVLLPLFLERSGSVGGALVVHSPHLVAALGSLWDTLWNQALPLPNSTAPGRSGLTALLSEEGQLIDLLLSGAKSETIAHQLGVGVSTVERRIRRLMRTLGADTRFQAGYQLARRLTDAAR